MKDAWGFIVWQWSKFDTWQRFYLLSAAFFGAGMVADKPLAYMLLAIPMIVVLVSVLKWFLWDSLIRSWKEYQREKKHLLELIKSSDSTK